MNTQEKKNEEQEKQTDVEEDDIHDADTVPYMVAAERAE